MGGIELAESPNYMQRELAQLQGPRLCVYGQCVYVLGLFSTVVGRAARLTLPADPSRMAHTTKAV